MNERDKTAGEFIEKSILFSSEMVQAILAGRKTQTRRLIKPQPKYATDSLLVPYKIGTRLWVRETWQEIMTGTQSRIVYKADNDSYSCKWRPSVHMPREASRITLVVERVRTERIQAITLSDCLAEGCPYTVKKARKLNTAYGTAAGKVWFRDVWRGLYGFECQYNWNADPLVWVVMFSVAVAAARKPKEIASGGLNDCAITV